MATSDVLVLGPHSAGKSSLVKALASVCRGSQATVDPLDTVPTTGVEIDHLALGSGREIQLREIGSTMRAMWSTYFSGCRFGILYVVDASEDGYWAEALVDLAELLAHPDMTSKPVQIVATKCDRALAFDNESIAAALLLDTLNAARAEAATGRGAGLSEASPASPAAVRTGDKGASPAVLSSPGAGAVPPVSIIRCSAQTRDGTRAVLEWLSALLPRPLPGSPAPFSPGRTVFSLGRAKR